MILVTGGTGLVGSHLLYQLVQEQKSVTAIFRTRVKLAKVKEVFSFYSEEAEALFAKIKWVEADLNDLSSLQLAFKGVSQVYHCAALISFDPNDFRKLVKVNEEGTANVVNLCISNGVEKLCYVSSIAALGKEPGKNEVTEQDEWKSSDVNPYALTKYLAEMEVWRGTQEGVPAVIVNPGVILGPGFWETGSGRLFKTAAKGSKYYPPGGTGFVCIEDVISMMIALMNSEVSNKRFIAVSENLTYKDVLSQLATNLGKPAPKRVLSIPLLEFLWRLDWIWHFLTGKKRKLSRLQVASLKNSSVYNNSRIMDFIDFKYSNLEERLPGYCNRFKEAYPSLFA